MRQKVQNKKEPESPQEKSPQNRIIYIGNFRVPFTTENHVAKSFEHLGWEVKRFQENTMAVKDVLDEAERGYRFLLYTRTWAECGRRWQEIMRKTKLPTVSFHLDLYLGLDRGDDLRNDPFFKSDYVFSADCGHQEEFKVLGINHFGLSPGVFGEECYLGEKEKRFEGDVIFVGSFNYHPEWTYRRTLINWLRNTYGDRFRLWGSNQCVRGKDLNNLYASAKVAVGDSLYSPNYWSDRIPETLGRGGFLIHPRNTGLDKEFRYYKHFIPYNYGEFKILKEIIDYYVTHDKEREKIRLAGHKWVKENHTYVHKVKHILKTLGMSDDTRNR